MTEHESKCTECGGPVEAGKPCSNCLLQMVAQPTEQLNADLDDLPDNLKSVETTGTPELSKSQPIIPDIEAVRRAFPQLEIIELIGCGGMGTVFKARQPKLDRFVALKILSEKLAEKPMFAERFAQEGKLLARLSHPNIVTVYDYGESHGFYYLILEYVDGVNLRQAMREKRFTADQALAVVPKICEALQYAHDEGVLHRDIKPENILLDTKGRIKIADFGIGKLTPRNDISKNSGETQNINEKISETDHLTDTKLLCHSIILGTPNYMAPEQRDDPNNVDHRADIYSLGVVFYELLTGELPQGRFPLPSEKTPVGTEIDGIVQKALQHEREKRQQSAGEMKTAIEFVTENHLAGNETRNTKSDLGESFSASSSIFLSVPLFVFGIFVVFALLLLAMSVISNENQFPFGEIVRFWENSPVVEFFRPYFNPVAFFGVIALTATFITTGCNPKAWHGIDVEFLIK